MVHRILDCKFFRPYTVHVKPYTVLLIDALMVIRGENHALTSMTKS
jgi:hypothetical protein